MNNAERLGVTTIATEPVGAIQEMELLAVKQTARQSTRSTATSENGLSPNETSENDCRDRPNLELPSPHELRGLPPLDFRPPLLENWALGCSFIFNLAILAVLAVLLELKTFTVPYSWSYFVLTVLPIVLGTMTSSLLDGTIESLSRIRPFMMCAVSGSEPRQHRTAAKRTLLRNYFPFLGLRESFRTRNWLLLFSNVLTISKYFIVPLKASILITNHSTYAEVVDWAIYPLQGLYASILLFNIAIYSHLRGRETGLRWDPVSISDQLILFRHSDFLDRFAGTCIAKKDSIVQELGAMHLRLGYWRRGDTYWHGFGLLAETSREGNQKQERKGESLSIRQLSQIRYNAASWVVSPLSMWFFTSLSFFFFGGYASTLALRYIRGDNFLVTFSSTTGALVFSVVLTGFSTLYNDYWGDMRMFAAATEPFVHLHMDEENNEQEASHLGIKQRPNAHDTLLLNYKHLPSVVIIHSALKRRHWKVARTAAVALVQRGLPILVGSSFVISYSANNTGASVIISIPFFVAIIAWMFVYVLLIPYEVRESGYTRHLPRSLESIADLLSWTYSSTLLKGCDNGDGGRVDWERGSSPGNDPLDIEFKLQHLEPTSGKESDWGVEVERWHLEARLLLSKTRFCFGLSKIHGTDEHTIGICNSEDAIDVLQAPASSALLSRKRRKNVRHQDNEVQELEYSIAGAQDFKLIKP